MQTVVTCLTDNHNPWLVLLAVVICLCGCATSVGLLQRAAAAAGRSRALWTVLAALVAGNTVWTTHFLAMLAWEPGLPTGYAAGPTILSGAVMIVMAGLAFLLLLMAGDWRTRAAAGLVFGAGIGTMHLIGMDAVQLPGHLGHAPGMVWAAWAIGLGMAAAALTPGLPRGLPGLLRTTLALALAIAGLHFTAMAGLTVFPDGSRSAPDALLPRDLLGVMIGAATLCLIGAALAGALFDRRVADMAAQERERLLTLADAAFEGVLVVGEGRILDANRSAAALLGRDAAALVGSPADALFAGDSRQVGAAVLDAASGEPARVSLDLPGALRPAEVLARRLPGGQTVLALRDLSERISAEQRIRHLAHHDPLTDLPNRTLFNDRLLQALNRARRNGERVAVMALDLDRFKPVTTCWATPPATSCCARRDEGSATACATPTPPRGWAATSSPS